MLLSTKQQSDGWQMPGAHIDFYPGTSHCRFHTSPCDIIALNIHTCQSAPLYCLSEMCVCMCMCVGITELLRLIVLSCLPIHMSKARWSPMSAVWPWGKCTSQRQLVRVRLFTTPAGSLYMCRVHHKAPQDTAAACCREMLQILLWAVQL